MFHMETIEGIHLDEFVKRLDESIERLIEYSRMIEKTPKCYGTNQLITTTEIHTIEAVGNHPNANVTELAELRGVTKGTLSKMLNRLEKAGFIRRFQFKDNKKECFFQLTELGKKAYEGHYAMHTSISKETYERYRQYTKQERALILQFLDIYNEYLKSYF